MTLSGSDGARECGHHSVWLLNSKTSSIHLVHICNLSQTRTVPLFAYRFAEPVNNVGHAAGEGLTSGYLLVPAKFGCVITNQRLITNRSYLFIKACP